MPLGAWSLSQDFTTAKVGTIFHTAKCFVEGGCFSFNPGRFARRECRLDG